eukprot:TRINITY_DN6861_c0_g2_i1.p1 TRINITY_DN6861_c0_g2~~TRINITY_DN6861_c0_g2_i1.p1  ORF type:complete len:708 (+),score=135.71 TRINITY_DN6861_c0_g2_i1:87-2210(+)
MDERFVEQANLPRKENVTVTRDQQVTVYLILILLYFLAFSIRLYSVVRYESVIHEFDPQFNFRATRQLADHGIEDFVNWFDTLAWYPLGRWVGHTVYPGLMATASGIHYILGMLSVHADLRNVCVFFAPVFAGNTAVVTYLLTKEAFDTGAAICAAAFMAIIPGYASRSVAGSYDNEAIAIFALVNTFYCFVRAVKLGSMKWAAISSLAYGFMISTWGGYIYIANLLPVYVYGMILLGKYTHRLYVAYSVFHVLGTLMSLQVPFVGFGSLSSATHALGHIVFVLLQGYCVVGFLKTHLSKAHFMHIIKALSIVAAFAVVLLFVAANLGGGDGRFAFLLNPGGNKLAIVASVSEHQAATWANFWYDMAVLGFLVPVGAWYCLGEWTDASIFILAYYATALYFSSVMIRLILILAPVMCVLGGIAVSRTLHKYFVPGDEQVEQPKSKRPIPPSERWLPIDAPIKKVVLVLMTLSMFFFIIHSRWVVAEVYSSPSIIIRTTAPNGQQAFYDDYREAYYWLRQNTPPDAKIMSWWDYGYQTATMANRTTIVDNNTWNNTHIATVGKCLASDEEECYRIMRKLDVDYVLVVFGGLVGYSSDDIGKFLWMIKIAGSVYPEIKKSDYFGDEGRYSVDHTASPKLLNSMMYKMCYHRFGEVSTEGTNGPSELGFDRVRRTVIGRKDFNLTRIEEAFTTSHWMIRLYRVLKEPNRG